MSFGEGGAEVSGKRGRCPHSPNRVADILLNSWEHRGKGTPLPLELLAVFLQHILSACEEEETQAVPCPSPSGKMPSPRPSQASVLNHTI